MAAQAAIELSAPQTLCATPNLYRLPTLKAVMELGATVCRPKNPDCGSCPASGCCKAYAEWKVGGGYPLSLDTLLQAASSSRC